MLIINADDFGRSRLATDRILSCFQQGSLTSTSAMVFMEDSQRAAELTRENCIDVGLHLNFTQILTQRIQGTVLGDYHNCIVRFLTGNKYNFLIFNPGLRKQFKYVFQAQFEEFERLYGTCPSHIDGHHHMHLCTNMLFDAIIPEGQMVRKNLSFGRGEKNLFNRAYRTLIDKWLARRYLTTDNFFSLSDRIQSGRLTDTLGLANNSVVELETHPEVEEEYRWLMGNSCKKALANIRRGTFAQLKISALLKNKSSNRNE